MKNDNRLLFAFFISILLHILVGFSIYMLKGVNIQKPKEEEKVRIAFKRGGDSKQENSTFKENTSIPSKISNTKAESSQNDIVKYKAPPPQKPKTNDIKTPNESKAPKQNQSNSSINFASLQVYKQPDTKQNLEEKNYQKNINLINSANIPSDQKQDIIDLYGDELGDFGTEEIDYLINNLRNIGRITQYYINRRGYPQDAAMLGQSGKNVVEFYLYPNGDISDLKIVTSSKSSILDNDMLTNIRIAYKDYPRPKTKVKIRIYMTYYLE